MKVILKRPLFINGRLVTPDPKGVDLPDGTPLPKGAKKVEEPAKPAPKPAATKES